MTDERPIIVIGGGGFIGRPLVARLAAQGTPVTAVVRSAAAPLKGVTELALGNLGAATDWPALCHGARAVIHLASRAHSPLAAGSSEDWIAQEAAMAGAIAQGAKSAGVERLVLMSSIKVQGDETRGVPFRAADVPAPSDAYGRAKLAIEGAMRAAAPGLPLVVLRPPLVYGPGVKSNFRALLRLVNHGLPLPLARVHNRRAFVFLENLLDLVELVLAHPDAPGQVLLLRDDDEVSTPALIALIARRLGRPARLFPFPATVLRALGRMTGHATATERLLGSLAIDDGATRAILGWQPRVALADGIAATCRWYRAASLGEHPGSAHGFRL